ncbi:unnamed protein product [Camellia sinensis]
MFSAEAIVVAMDPSGDALNMLKTNLVDPNNVLQSWDATLATPCTWFHVTCNSENSVTRVDLGNANLSGQLVPELGQLLNLQYLELYSNNIRGQIPIELGNLTSLVSLDLFSNNLSSIIPDTLGSSATGAIAGGVAAGAALLFADPTIALAWWRRRKPEDSFFDVPGRCGFCKVYKGRLANGSLVVVKRLKEERTQGGELQFQTEVEIISMAVHRNLLRLHGFCMTPTERSLVYPSMSNGSVASCLRERCDSQPPLDWPKRKRIALGSARGLTYLHDHCNPKIIHRDVKAANILLDDEFEAVVGDIGLAKLMDYKDTHVTTAVRGTIGHIAPEYLSTGKSSEKTNVFGYGVMLLELITGQRAFDLARLVDDDNDVMLLDWVKGLLKDRKVETLVDEDMQGNYVEDQVEQLIQVALLCTLSSPMERPQMSEVVRMLEGDGLEERWEEWQEEEIHPQKNNWIIAQFNNLPDSTPNLPPEELSGPR